MEEKAVFVLQAAIEFAKHGSCAPVVEDLPWPREVIDQLVLEAIDVYASLTESLAQLEAGK